MCRMSTLPAPVAARNETCSETEAQQKRVQVKRHCRAGPARTGCHCTLTSCTLQYSVDKMTSVPASSTKSRFAPSSIPPAEPMQTRKRESASTSWVANAQPSPDIKPLLEALLQPGLHEPLDKLIQLTSWQEENQREVVQHGGAALLCQFIKSKVRFDVPSVPGQPALADMDVQIISKALNVVMNVSSHDDLASRVAAVPTLAQLLTELLSHPARSVSIMAARCLINITHSSADGPLAALEAGVVNPAILLFLNDEEDHAARKLGAQLLVNLTAAVNAPSRGSLVAHPQVARRAVALLGHDTTPVAVIVPTSQLICNLARAGSTAQSALAKAGVLSALSELLEQKVEKGGKDVSGSEIFTAVLPAISALALDHADNTAALASRTRLCTVLGLILDVQTSPFSATWEDSSTVHALHTLVHVIGHMLCNGGRGLPVEPSNVSISSPGSHHQASAPSVKVVGSDAHQADGRMSLVVPGGKPGDSTSSSWEAAAQQVVYISLSAAARAMKVTLPAVTSVTGKHGETPISPIEAAELRHRVTHVLLPRLRSSNHHTATTAATSLYHLVAACGGATAREARRLIADAALIEQLLAVLRSDNAALQHASLSVLDVLASEPACTNVMVAVGWMPAVLPLLDSKDALVRRWAERTLCSMYMATSSAA